MIGSPLVIAEKARARMEAILARMRDGHDINANGLIKLHQGPGEADVVITACEVSPAHGTGTLLLRIFPYSSDIVSFRTSNFYDGVQAFGGTDYCLPLAQSSRREIASWVKWCLAGTKVRRILALPYLPADPLVAITVQEVTGAPLCTYIMDDKNVCAGGIEDAAMDEMLERSRLRLVISPEMRDAYRRKYRREFYVMPPLVPEAHLRREPVWPPFGTDTRRGILLGNIWGQRWLDMLRGTLRGSGYHLDWFCNQKNPAGLEFNRAELDADGITFNEPIPEARLPEILARYPFAVVPTDTLDGASLPSVQAIAELSLPSRIPTMVAMAHLPMLVVGHPGTCASRFVSRFRLGEIVPYDRATFGAAAARLTDISVQTEIRSRAAALAGKLSAENSSSWIWDSLNLGRPVDMRYESLMPAEVEFTK